jgi:hypothetical protein
MKLKSTLNKLPLIALLSLGLVCTPLVVSASDSGHGRHGHYQQDHDKHHKKAARHWGYRDYGHQQSCGLRNSYRKACKHGNIKGHRHHSWHGHHDNHDNYDNVQRHQRNGHRDEHPRFLLGLLSDD